MQQLTEHGRRIVDDLARRHGVSPDAVLTLLLALMEGRGTQAQFNHPELGGMGQWSQGGMLMIGDMFNNALKARVDALATELAAALRGGELLKRAEPRDGSPASSHPSQSQSQSQGPGGAGGDVVSLFAAQSSSHWWPADLGQPAATGAQNSMRYAFFPATRRLAIDLGGTVTVYDTGDHRIAGFSQQQGGGQSATFTSQHGLVRVADLPVVPLAKAGGAAAGGGAAKRPDPAPDSQAGDVFAKIERLAELRDKGVISEKEFEAKKTELLSRI
jgi:hypothetical protein